MMTCKTAVGLVDTPFEQVYLKRPSFHNSESFLIIGRSFGPHLLRWKCTNISWRRGDGTRIEYKIVTSQLDI